jgi:Transposase DNA-binding/Transposase Tn5 dimerisation domain
VKLKCQTKALKVFGTFDMGCKVTDVEGEDPSILGEIEGSEFADKRLGARFKRLVSQLAENLGAAIPLACEDWANTKAAYRFISNPRVHEGEILSGHFESTRKRFNATSEPVLILHDTTEFSFKRKKDSTIGLLKKLPKSSTMRDAYGEKYITTCGILMHSSLAVTASGLPLGLGAIKFWTRDRFKGRNALKHEVNTTRIPIEQKESIRWLENLRQSTALFKNPARCIHIGDRESDIYELFCCAEEVQTNFLFRTCADRLTGDGKTLVSLALSRTPIKGFIPLTVCDKDGNENKVSLEIKYATLTINPPVDKRKRYPALVATVIEARERGDPKGRDPIVWKLITNLKVNSLAKAAEKLQWYAMRWKIETFHKILKSGCRAEDSRLRTAERLVNLISIFCILSWRIFWMTMLQRTDPNSKASLVFTQTEISILTQLLKKNGLAPGKRVILTDYIIQVAKLGGYLARKSDPPPGNIVMWRGLSRLSDIQLGATLQPS